MRLKKTISKSTIIILLIFTLIQIYPSFSQGSVYTSPTYRFNLDENSNFTVVSRAPLSWKENIATNFNITFEATGIPVSGNITIKYVDITYVYPDNNTEIVFTQTADFELNETFNLYYINTTLIAPFKYNLFNISIEIVANSSTQPDHLYIAYFPGDKSYIQVERGAVAPIINLPGFPNVQTFVRWIIIFFIIFIIMITPALFIGIPATYELSKKTYKKLNETIARSKTKHEERRIKKKDSNNEEEA